jgi:hypothetical protein
MSALIALMKDEDLTAVFENVFMESAAEILAGLSDDDLEKVAQYVAMLKEKKVKPSDEAEISETLVPVLEHNAALYGTFLYESVEEELTDEEAKKLLETVREHFGREFIIEAMSPENKARLKKAAKIAGGVGAAGLAAGAAYANKDDIAKGVKKAGDTVKNFVSGDGSGAKVAGDRPNTTAGMVKPVDDRPNATRDQTPTAGNRPNTTAAKDISKPKDSVGTLKEKLKWSR